MSPRSWAADLRWRRWRRVSTSPRGLLILMKDAIDLDHALDADAIERLGIFIDTGDGCPYLFSGPA